MMTVTVHPYGLVACTECHPDGAVMDRRSHTRIHQQWEHGALIPAATLRRFRDRLPSHRVAHIAGWNADPVPLRRVAYEAARVVRREGGWDFVSFPWPRRDDDLNSRWREPECHGYLYVIDTRVAGYLVAYIEQRMASWDRPHTVLGPFGVADAHRRTGIGRQLFTAAVAHAESSGHPPAWLTPFTTVGKRFAEAMDPDHKIVLSR